VLTEAGRVALDYAETIGRAGGELMDVMQHRPSDGRQILRVAAVATLSRNFQLEFVRPALHRADVEVVIRSGGLRELLVMLHAHQVDLVLANQPAKRDAETSWHSHLLAEQSVSLVGTAEEAEKKRLRFPEDFRDLPVILPSMESHSRAGFDCLLEAAGVRVRVMAEVDDMAMLRLLAREGDCLALVPKVVVRDEIERGELVETHRIPQLRETLKRCAQPSHLREADPWRVLLSEKIFVYIHHEVCNSNSAFTEQCKKLTIRCDSLPLSHYKNDTENCLTYRHWNCPDACGPDDYISRHHRC